MTFSAIAILSGDSPNELNETFKVSLVTPGSGVTLDNPSVATVLIVDTEAQHFVGDNQAPGLTLSFPGNNSTQNINTGSPLAIGNALYLTTLDGGLIRMPEDAQ